MLPASPNLAIDKGIDATACPELIRRHFVPVFGHAANLVQPVDFQKPVMQNAAGLEDTLNLLDPTTSGVEIAHRQPKNAESSLQTQSTRMWASALERVHHKWHSNTVNAPMQCRDGTLRIPKVRSTFFLTDSQRADHRTAAGLVGYLSPQIDSAHRW